MDDQALVEGSVVFKDEDDPIIKTEIGHSAEHEKRKEIKMHNSESRLSTSVVR